MTNIDTLIEEEWSRSIRRRYPKHGILGEESGSSLGDSDITWVLDPIDGTDDLIRNSALFGSIIAVLYRGEPIAAVIDHPRLDLRCEGMFGSKVLVNGTGIEAVRSSPQSRGDVVILPAYEDLSILGNCDGFIARIGRQFPNQRIYRNVYGHTMVIQGRFSAGLEVDVALWDLAATKLLVELTGGKFLIFRDTAGDYDRRRFGAIFGNEVVVDKIAELLNELD